jgi:hypothetical protein
MQNRRVSISNSHAIIPKKKRKNSDSSKAYFSCQVYLTNAYVNDNKEGGGHYKDFICRVMVIVSWRHDFFGISSWQVLKGVHEILRRYRNPGPA